MNTIFYDLLICILGGLIAGITSCVYSGFLALRYSEFIACKNDLLYKINMTHLNVCQLGSANYSSQLMELVIAIDAAQIFYTLGNNDTVCEAGAIKSDILTLKNLLSVQKIPTLQASDYFINWETKVKGFGVSWINLISFGLLTKSRQQSQ
jgi:hypothetical protein